MMMKAGELTQADIGRTLTLAGTTSTIERIEVRRRVVSIWTSATPAEYADVVAADWPIDLGIQVGVS